MGERPYVLLSCACSLDGHIDDATDRRLLLSGAADLDRVDEVRAGCDAIMVGASTLRADDPRLVVRSPERRAARVARGENPTPVKVTLTRNGGLDPTALFFTTGDTDKLVYTAGDTVRALAARLGGSATVGDAGDPPSLDRVLEDLARRGVRRLLVEGGTSLHTQFLTTGLADELHLVLAPFFVGDPAAPRFVGPGTFVHDARRRARLLGLERVGDCALLRYALSERCGTTPE